MSEILRTLGAMLAGAIAAILWLERQTSTRPSPPTPPAPPTPEPERVVEEVVVPDPQQAARIEALEAELAEQHAIRTPEPGEAHPGVDAIRAARARAFELERRLSRRDDDTPRWFEIEPSSAAELLDHAAERLPRVAIRVETDSTDPSALWNVLGAMQEFADASGGAWFEFDGDFARWCLESGHHVALDPEQVGVDEARPTFTVEARVNRSGRMVVPTYVRIGDQKLYYIDDVAGETGRMHVVGMR